ncbi:MAG: hypothetical protein OXH51_13820 [Gemmatimonadetes bacterium]|nr:hypothetical protein [Gemmatimonadota bacterium]
MFNRFQAAAGLTGLVLLPTHIAPTPGSAQEAEDPPGHKDPIIAFAMEMVVPVLGHAYAGDARRGIAPALVHVAGYGLIGYGVTRALDCLLCGSGGGDDDTDGVIIITGLAAAVVGKVWGLVSVASTVRDHNASLVVEPTPDRQLALGLKVKF